MWEGRARKVGALGEVRRLEEGSIRVVRGLVQPDGIGWISPTSWRSNGRSLHAKWTVVTPVTVTRGHGARLALHYHHVNKGPERRLSKRHVRVLTPFQEFG